MVSFDPITAAKQRWLDFYDFSKPRQHRYNIYYLPGLSERPWPYPENFPARIEWAWKKYQMMLEKTTWLIDDWIPYLDMYTGTEIFAAAFGCKVYYPGTDMPFALPLIQSISEISRLKVPSLDNPVFEPIFAAAEELRRRAGPQALLRMVDIQSPMDIAALILEKTSYYPALIETPDAILELADKVRSLLTCFLDEWFSRFGRDYIAHYPDYYMPYGITLSEDEVGAVSSPVFNRYFLPELEYLSNRYGQMGIHCCANARHQWKNFLRVPNLKIFNINQPTREIRAAVPFFGNSIALYPIPGSDGYYTDPEEVPAPARLVWEFSPTSRDEALRIVDKMQAYTGR